MKRHRIVLDTNVLISAILFNGPPRKILERVIGGAVDCSLSLPILDELRDVLQRPKFGFSPAQAFQVLEELHAVCEVINPEMANSMSVKGNGVTIRVDRTWLKAMPIRKRGFPADKLVRADRDSRG